MIIFGVSFYLKNSVALLSIDDDTQKCSGSRKKCLDAKREIELTISSPWPGPDPCTFDTTLFLSIERLLKIFDQSDCLKISVPSINLR